MHKADLVREYALSTVGMPYKWGEEAWYVVGTEQTKTTDVDCSGLVYAVFRRAGVLVNGKQLPRETADDYWRRANAIAKPERVGDCCWFPRTGRKTHIALYLGRGPAGREAQSVIEAGNHGPGGSYPGSGYVGLCTVAQMNARGAVWGRFRGIDIGTLEDDMTPDEVRAIVREELEWGGTSAEIKTAESHLVRLGLISRGRPPAKGLTWGLFALLLSRVLKLLGRP